MFEIPESGKYDKPSWNRRFRTRSLVWVSDQPSSRNIGRMQLSKALESIDAGLLGVDVTQFLLNPRDLAREVGVRLLIISLRNLALSLARSSSDFSFFCSSSVDDSFRRSFPRCLAFPARPQWRSSGTPPEPSVLAEDDQAGFQTVFHFALCHLRTSRCKPWRDSTNEERLNGENGFLLTPTMDHLFDRGSISFEDSGTLITSPVAHLPSLNRWEWQPTE